jgi:hypothetical protein
MPSGQPCLIPARSCATKAHRDHSKMASPRQTLKVVHRMHLRNGWTSRVNCHPVKPEMSVAAPKSQAKEPIQLDQLDIILVCRKQTHGRSRTRATLLIRNQNQGSRQPQNLQVSACRRWQTGVQSWSFGKTYVTQTNDRFAAPAAVQNETGISLNGHANEARPIERASKRSCEGTPVPILGRE